MNARKETDQVCIVTTSKVPSAFGSSQDADAAQILDPVTGAILSGKGGSAALKSGSGIGIYSFAQIPLPKNSSASNMFIASCGKSIDDMNAHLIIQGTTASPAWKCRLPESMEGGFLVSPCGNYIIGAAKSGKCYCWSTFQDGELLKCWAAHYRPIQDMVFSDCGSFLVTGGADGIINTWSMMDIVEDNSSKVIHAKNHLASISPIKTWSEHQLPITSLHALPSSRAISTSIDRNVVIIELFSGRTLAKISMPSAINVVTADSCGRRLYLGSSEGTIYCIDIDAYTIATTTENAKVVMNAHDGDRIDSRGPSVSGSLLEETILGMKNSSDNSYTTELQGHEGALTCLKLLEDGDTELLISGGQDGSVRVWDIKSRCCVKTLYPWSASGSGNENQTYPCSSISLIDRSSLDSRTGSNVFSSDVSHSKHKNRLLEFVKPLQRFEKSQAGSTSNDGYVTDIVRSNGTSSESSYHTVLKRVLDLNNNKQGEKRLRHSSLPNTLHDGEETGNNIEAENEELKRELANAKEMIERWKKVNNKLALKLKQSSK